MPLGRVRQSRKREIIVVNKLVSIIMPAYNCADYIADSIRSVQAQTYFNWELIVADDKSTDGTAGIARDIAADDNRICLLETDINLGPAGARNRAIDVAHGDYIAFLDSDDVWHPDKLKKQISFMEQNGYGFTYTAYEKIDNHGEPMGIVISAPNSVNYTEMLYRGDPIGNSTVVYDAEKLGKFHVPDIKRRNDFALWLKMMHDCDCAYGLNEVLVSYRVHSGSISSTHKLELMKYHWMLYRDVEGLSNVKSVAAMTTLVFFKSVKLTGEKIQQLGNSLKSKRITEIDPKGIQENRENIIFERTEENNVSTVIGKNTDTKYAEK